MVNVVGGEMITVGWVVGSSYMNLDAQILRVMCGYLC